MSFPDLALVEEEDQKHIGQSAPDMRAPSVQNYVERRLTEVHIAAKDYKLCDKFIAISLPALLLILMPYLHIGVLYLKIWVPDKAPINKQDCTCSCFDSVFKGSYEMPGLTSYKHVYFNATKNTFKIWMVTVMFLIMFYESVKYLMAVYRRSRFRPAWLALYLINLYPHYYSWWSFFSYYNDEFYKYFTHHMFFCVTEIVTTVIVLNLCNRENELKAWKMMTILAINLVHVIVSGSDQFFAHVLQGHGTNFQNARNIALMVPDMLHIAIPARQFYMFVKHGKRPLLSLCYKEEIVIFFVFISLGSIFGKFV